MVHVMKKNDEKERRTQERAWPDEDPIGFIAEARRLGWTVRVCLRTSRYLACSVSKRAPNLVMEVVAYDSRFSQAMMSNLVLADQFGLVDMEVNDWAVRPSLLPFQTAPSGTERRFLLPTGVLEITPFALVRVRPEDVLWNLARHRERDWQELSEYERCVNIRGMFTGERIVSRYRLVDDVRLFIVTMGGGEKTTVLIGEDTWDTFWH